jgi:hypothetical protein
MSMKKIVIAAAGLALAASLAVPSYAWLTDMEKVSAVAVSAEYGHVDIDLEISSSTVNSDGSPIKNGDSQLFADFSAIAYPGAFLDSEGNSYPNAKSILSYTAANKSKEPVLAQISQSGLLYHNQEAPSPDAIKSASFDLHCLNGDFIYTDTPPLANGLLEDGKAYYIDHAKLRAENFFGSDSIPLASQAYNIFNPVFYEKRSLVIAVGETSTGLLMTPAIELDPGAKLATDGTGDWVYLYLPKDAKARFSFEFSIPPEAAPYFANAYQYSVITLNTSAPSGELEAYAIQPIKEAFESHFIAGAEEVSRQLGLDWQF